MDEGTPRSCRRCQYDLRGIEVGVCPECGASLEAPEDVPLPRGCRYALGMLLVAGLCLAAVLLMLAGPQSVVPVGPLAAVLLLGIAWLILRGGDPTPGD